MAQTSNTKRKTGSSASSRKNAKKNTGSGSQLWGVVLFFCGGFSFLGYFMNSHWLIDALSVYVLKGLFGWGFLVAPPVLVFCAFLLLLKAERAKQRTACLLSLPALLGSIVHLIRCGAQYSMAYTSAAQFYTTGLSMRSGGLISGYLSELLREAISPYGAMPLLVAAFLICGISGLGVSWSDLVTAAPKAAREEKKTADKKAAKKQDELFVPAESLPTIMQGSSSRRARAVAAADIFPEESVKPKKGSAKKAKKNESVEEELPPIEDIPVMPQGYDTLRKTRENANVDALLEDMSAAEEKKKRRKAAVSPFIAEPAAPLTSPEPSKTAPESAKPAPAVSALPPLELETEKASHEEVKQATIEVAAEIGNAEKPDTYVFPPLELLEEFNSSAGESGEEIRVNTERLNTCLKSFNVGARVTGVTRGPSVTRYDLELDAGLRLTKLTNLAGDLALNLGVENVRIAPVPDKVSTVGVEVPNRHTSTVGLRELLESNSFRKAKSPLSFAIGKDISGDCIVGNISKLPHMLIAGTTGSGKSVCMNCLILSLLYKASPDEVRLIMIDPKMVELQIYNGIPHLYIPVVTDPKKAAGALQWSVVEMMKRYRLFSEVNVRDLEGYNEIQRLNGEDPMPSLVIVIDELADLMMTAAKEVEESICRVAQMGRAAGVHLVIATQRPSADVITGLMKANIPSRIAFAVSSSMESRIIMDQSGAEKLVGKGDMLYSPIGMGKPQRIQGAFVSDEEREAVIDFIKQGSEAHYDQSVIREIEQKVAQKEREKEKGNAPRSAIADEIAADSSNELFAGFDELIPRAVEIVLDEKQGSVSHLQRRLKVGFSRAGRIMDEMEELGLVGPAEGTKPRKVLITRERWEAICAGEKSDAEKLMDESKDDFSAVEEELC
ncbi:MAG: DNA translocase FtsK [Oscillospiraceae bacterium]|nr:DNA translocase FtsK [Oscillospiraceae bacterium]